MNLSLYDWGIMAFAIVALRLFSLSTRRHMKGVSDFLSANRAAGRYLLVISQQMGIVGAISYMALFEMYHQAGFTPIWWSFLFTCPRGPIMILTGWIYYRFRETRALTMAQFFEMRYSRRFRAFAGTLCWLSGILSFGIFPAVAARFFIYFCGIPEQITINYLPFAIPTFPIIMLIDLGLALTFVTMGGQVSVMVTECIQGIFNGFVLVIVIATTLLIVQWSSIADAITNLPANQSMVNPFHTGGLKDFNVWYFIISAIGEFYSYMSWQGTQGFNSSARTPHEQKMAGIIGGWRDVPSSTMAFVLPLAAFAMMKLPEFSGKATVVLNTLNNIPTEAIQEQMRVPVVLAHLLPIGIKGLFATAILFVSFTSMDANMHSWGSIFIQDVYLPIKKKVLTPEQHIKYLRWSIIGVCAFAFLFSCFYPMGTKILLFMAITRTIWMGGSGAAVIGGLYWKRGTAAAAYTALIIGATLGGGGLIVPQLYKSHFGHEFPINGQWLWAIAMCTAGIVYIVVSLITSHGKEPYNIEKLLHRGKYAVESDHVIIEDRPKSKLLELIGIREEFTKPDRALALLLVIWMMTAWIFVLTVTIISLFHDLGNAWWTNMWHVFVLLYLAISVPSVVWFSIGGVLDIKALFRTLSSAVRDHTDDGRVFHEPDRIAASIIDTESQPIEEDPEPA